MKKTVLIENRNVEKKLNLGTTSQTSQAVNPLTLIPHWVTDFSVRGNSRNDKMVLEQLNCNDKIGNQRIC